MAVPPGNVPSYLNLTELHFLHSNPQRVVITDDAGWTLPNIGVLADAERMPIISVWGESFDLSL